METDRIVLRDQVTVHLVIWGCFMIPCKRLFALTEPTWMASVSAIMLALVVIALLVRVSRLNKGKIQPFEETQWKSPLYTALAAFCIVALETSPIFLLLAALLAAMSFYLLYQSVVMLKENGSI
ncbi:MAG: hypothetical protein IJ255_06190 [Bacteroidales bacterium]|nr:hypothetical protein [Bacteroidales bacterium]